MRTSAPDEPDLSIRDSLTSPADIALDPLLPFPPFPMFLGPGLTSRVMRRMRTTPGQKAPEIADMAEMCGVNTRPCGEAPMGNASGPFNSGHGGDARH